MAKRKAKGEGTTIVIRRIEGGGGGHHGGAWKVAYADFVTAMMAFFLLMWLINATSEQQRRGIAAYFSPMANVESGFSGVGLVPGGVSPLDKGMSLVDKGTGAPPPPDPTQTGTTQPPKAKGMTPTASTDGTEDSDGAGTDSVPGGPQDGADKSGAGKADEAHAATAEQARLEAAAERLRQAVAADPALAGTSGQLAIDVTPDGLRIQIMDSESQPMFDRGATLLNARAQALLRKVAPFLATLPEPVSVGGYTDGAPAQPGTRSNWTLSAARADAARDLLTEAGLPDRRISDVTGFADRHLLLPADPLASANRRVVLTLHRQHPAPPADRS